MSKVAIIDYNCGNIFSLANAFNAIKQPFDIVDNDHHLANMTMPFYLGRFIWTCNETSHRHGFR